MVAVIINPVAGGRRRGAARWRAETARAALAAAREDGEVFVTEGKGHARALASRAVDRGARLVVAWGGDGTVNEVASELIFGQTPIAIVPAGSGNGLARDLGAARQPGRALAEALGAAPRAIDAGRFGGHLFFSVAGVGFDAHVAGRFDRGAFGRGQAAYLRICAWELLVYRSATYRVGHGSTFQPVEEEPGTRSAPTARRALLVTVANSSQFGGGACIAPSARLDDGRLDLVVFEEVSRLATLCALPRLFTRRVTGLDGFSVHQIQRASIESDQPMLFHVDGEPISGGTRLETRVYPAALRVCVR